MKKSLENLLLLSCRSPFLNDSKIYAPMANLYLKSYVERELPNVKVTLGDDNYDLDNPEMFEPYDAIGLSIMTPQREEALKILNTIKSKYPNKVVQQTANRFRAVKLIRKSDKDYLIVTIYDSKNEGIEVDKSMTMLTRSFRSHF